MTSEQLLETLDALDREKLKRFNWHLKQDAHASAVDLENADTVVTVDLMMACCGPERAVKITLNILRKMKLNHLAEDLENKLKGNHSCKYQLLDEFSMTLIVMQTVSVQPLD